MAIIGRVNEINQLHTFLDSKKSEFVAVYGRRRVGKTFLIREFFKNSFTFYATGLANANTKKQLVSFTIFVNQSFNKEYQSFNNWLEAFEILIKELKKTKKKRIIFIDELPWFDTKKSDFITGLDFFWNSWASAQKNVKLIVCGSAASWMINELIKNKGGLYNRVTARIKLEPFTLQETELFLKSKQIQLDRYQIIQLYMVMGGVPYYLDHVQKGLSATQNIQKLCFDANGLLKSEFTFIFSSLFSGGEKHEIIIKTLYKLGGHAKRDDIIEAAKLTSGGDVTIKLNELEDSGFITTHTVFGNRSAKKTYSISDFYTLFYLKFINHLPKKSNENWQSRINDQAVKVWHGLAFEQVCIQHQQQIKEALKIGGIETRASTWQLKGTKKVKGAQIDLIIDRSDRVINLCELKFYTNPFTINKAYDLVLRNKVGTFKQHTNTNKSVFLTMITTFGIVKNEYSQSIIQNHLTMDDLFVTIN